MDNRVINMAEETIINALEKCDSDNKKVIVCRTIQYVLRNLFASTLKCDTETCEAFVAAEV